MKTFVSVALLVLLGLGAYWVFTHPVSMDNANMRAGAEVQAEEVQYFAGATGYFARPAGPGDYPGVVMIHENRGLRPEIRQAAEDLAKEGYQVLAVDLLGPPVE